MSEDVPMFFRSIEEQLKKEKKETVTFGLNRYENDDKFDDFF